MKKNKATKSVNQNEKILPITLIGNTYNKNPNVLVILIIKILLTYVLAAGTIMCFVSFYKIPYSVSALVQQVLLYVTAMFPIFILIKKRYSIPAIAVLTGILYYYLHDSINSAAVLFKDYIFIQIDSRLLHTIQYVPQNSYAFFTRTQDFTSGMNTAMLVISGIVCFICVLCCCKKFHSIALFIMWAILYAPAFLSEEADYNNYILLIIPAFFGLYAIHSSNYIFTKIANHSFALDSADKKKRRQSEIEKAAGNLIKYSKNCLSGIIAAAITTVIAFTAQHAFPDMSTLDFDKFIENTVKLATDLGEYFGNIFSGGFTNGYNGYFTSDSFLINNNIELNSPPSTSNSPVLKITSNIPNQVYLMGDIGVDFTGTEWESVQRKTEKNSLTPPGYQISEYFNPDEILDIYRTALMFSEYTSNDLQNNYSYSYYYYMGKHNTEYDELYNSLLYRRGSFTNNLTVYGYMNIEYLKNSEIVFKPFLTVLSEYRQNSNFNCYGDTVIRVADSNNWMKNFSTSVSIPASDLSFAAAENFELDDAYIYQAMKQLDYSNGEIRRYINDKAEYTRYVRDTYMSVPDSEAENMRRLIKEFDAKVPNVADGDSDYTFAYEMCNYLKRTYEYSLTADNSATADSTVLGRFLFDTKKGHCALYASSMTLALRTHGIPARYVTGFSSGELEYNESDGKYEKTITESGLHAWVEAYFEDYGWLAFDPTGGAAGIDNPYQTQSVSSETNSTPQITTTTEETSSSAPETTDNNETTPPQTEASDTTSKSPDESNSETTDNTVLAVILISVFSVVIIAVGITAAVVCVRNKNIKRFAKFRKSDPQKAVKDMYGFIMKLFAVTDIAPESTELPLDFALRVDSLMKISGMKNNLFEIMNIIEKAEFSADSINEEEKQAVLKYTEMLYRLVLNSAGKIKRIYLKIVL